MSNVVSDVGNAVGGLVSGIGNAVGCLLKNPIVDVALMGAAAFATGGLSLGLDAAVAGDLTAGTAAAAGADAAGL